MEKAFKNLLLQDQKSYNLETCFHTLCIPALSVFTPALVKHTRVGSNWVNGVYERSTDCIQLLGITNGTPSSKHQCYSPPYGKREIKERFYYYGKPTDLQVCYIHFLFVCIEV